MPWCAAQVKIGVATGTLIIFLVMSHLFLMTFDDNIRACNEKYIAVDGRTKVNREDDGGFGCSWWEYRFRRW